ncbi:MAG: hypothetical protein NW217_00115 [Hyphomicrobiaceae bacterium]|nr:hypothetical protein [Hyphomicrobiaceae bacterium]
MIIAINAIHANITLIEQRLRGALALSVDAKSAAARGEQNLAIGTLLPVEHDLADAAALLKAVFVLHRSRADTASLPH